MTYIDRCLESLAFCHVQDDRLWASARIVAQQDIDELITEAGGELADQLVALQQLMAAFDERFPRQGDPVLIRSTMRRHLRRIEFDLKREGDLRRQFHDAAGTMDAPATVPEVDDAHAEAMVAPELTDFLEEHPEATVAPAAPDLDDLHQDATVAPDAADVHAGHEDVAVVADVAGDDVAADEPAVERGKTGA